MHHAFAIFLLIVLFFAAARLLVRLLYSFYRGIKNTAHWLFLRGLWFPKTNALITAEEVAELEETNKKLDQYTRLIERDSNGIFRSF